MLKIKDWTASNSIYSNKAGGQDFEVQVTNIDAVMCVNLHLAFIGISLITRQRQELVYLSLKDLKVGWEESAL